MPTAQTVLKAFEADERRMLLYQRRNNRAGAIYNQKAQRWLTQQLAEFVTDGRIQNNAVAMARIDLIERELPRLMAGEWSRDYTQSVISNLQGRLATIDATMNRIGLQGAVLGARVNTLPSVINAAIEIETAITRGTERAGYRVAQQIVNYKLQLGQRVAYSDFVGTITSRVGIAPKYAGTVCNTQLSALDRQLRTEQAKLAGLNLLRYTGPLRSETRDFCVRWLGEVRPIEFWEELENDTGPQPVLKFCGGYNCLHRLIPWSEDWD